VAWIAVIGLAGCDKLFSLEHLDEPPECPANYAPLAATRSVYRYVDETRLWDEAATDCNNDNPGTTHLVVLDDAAELVAVRTLVTAAPPYNVHVGYARDTVAAGGDPKVFYAVTGETLDLDAPTWDLWRQGEPDNYMGIETIVFIEDDQDMTDGEPARMQRYVCECDGRPATRTFTLR